MKKNSDGYYSIEFIDGGLEERSDLPFKNGHGIKVYEYYDLNKNSPPASGNDFMEWISHDTYLGSDKVYESPYYIYTLNGKKDDNGKESHESENVIIPFITGRKSYDPIVSQDSTKIAFLSKLGTEKNPSLFFVPTTGGEPQKIDTNYSFVPQNSNSTLDEVCLLEWIDGEADNSNN